MRRWALPLLPLLAMVFTAALAAAETPTETPVLVGRTVSPHGRPIAGVRARVVTDLREEPASALSREDGWFVIELSGPIPGEVKVTLERRHYESVEYPLPAGQRGRLVSGESVVLGPIEVPRRRSIGSSR
jgi:hypothetical protein